MTRDVMDAPTVEVDGLTKRFGAVTAVDDLAFTVRPGAVTGFLGPNGAGKTTTLRMLLGLVAPTAGRATVGGRPYAAHERPGRVVGAALEATGFHPGRTGPGHLETLAPALGVGRDRCREVLELVGLGGVPRQRVGQYSLGMRQRLGLAAALLGDPAVLVLDEPANGLDPEGIVWLRGLLRGFAGEGRTVLVSSHVLAEVQHTVDDVVIIAGGRLVHASSLAGLADLAAPAAYVESPAPQAVADLATARGWSPRPEGHGVLVGGATAAEVGVAAHAAGLELHQLVRRGADLEEVFLRLTAPRTDGRAGPASGHGQEVAR